MKKDHMIRYAFSEIPNNEEGRELVRLMRKYLNRDSWTMRVKGQHLKPELKGTGAGWYGPNLQQSTHLRVYMDCHWHREEQEQAYERLHQSWRAEHTLNQIVKAINNH